MPVSSAVARRLRMRRPERDRPSAGSPPAARYADRPRRAAGRRAVDRSRRTRACNGSGAGAQTENGPGAAVGAAAQGRDQASK